MPEVVQTWLRLSYLKVAFYAVQLFWSLGELVQDAAAFTEDFLQPLFQPIVALSVRERGRRGRSEIMVVNILKKTWGGQLCTGYEWKDGGTEIFSYESSNLLRVSSTQTGLLTRGMSPHFYLNIHVVRPAFEGQQKKKNPLQAIFVQLCSSSIWTKIQFREEIYFCHSLLRFNRYEMSLRAASLS